jgi:hypothetical protein
MARLVRFLALAVSVVALAVAATPAQAAGGFSCYYRLLTFPNSFFMADLFITNNGPAITSWTAHWTFSSDERLGNIWSAEMVQQNHDITARNLAWNGTVGTGQTAAFGWTAFATSTSVPTDITVNGVRCPTAP